MTAALVRDLFPEVRQVNERNLCVTTSLANLAHAPAGDLPRFIDKVYNTTRLHAVRGYRNSEKFERQHARPPVLAYPEGAHSIRGQNLFAASPG